MGGGEEVVGGVVLGFDNELGGGFVVDGARLGDGYGDELTEEIAFGAEIGGPLGRTAVFIVFAGVDDAGADAGYFELGVLKVDRDVVFGGFVKQGEDVALQGADANGCVLGLGDDVFCSLFIGHRTRPGQVKKAAVSCGRPFVTLNAEATSP